MFGGYIMTTENVVINQVLYHLNGKNIYLNKNTVDKYSDIVCPITERVLTALIHAFDDHSGDSILSARIENDMEKEIKEYGF